MTLRRTRASISITSGSSRGSESNNDLGVLPIHHRPSKLREVCAVSLTYQKARRVTQGGTSAPMRAHGRPQEGVRRRTWDSEAGREPIRLNAPSEPLTEYLMVLLDPELHEP